MTNLSIQPWFCFPFLAVLVSLAVLPTFWPRFWKKHHFFILLIFSLPAFALALAIKPSWALHGFVDYVNFICLLGALYKIGGGLFVSGMPKANPITNLAFMGLGALLASFIGTLGASMLLIRPLIRSDRGRKNEAHVIVFFIFIVSNCGGLLTPLGDPPLLYGFLSGVPFWWTLKLFPIWLFAITGLLGIFAGLDAYFFLKDPDFKGPLKAEIKEPFRIVGRWNLLLIFATGFALIFPQLLPGGLSYWRTALRIFLLMGIIQLSEKLTPQQIKTLNNYSWEPFKEVATIFAAIFATMIITLQYLQAAAPSLQYTFSPWNLYWLTGGLSAFLDNAPSYASMFSLALGLPKSYPVVNLVGGHQISEVYLMAISVASVFFGAATYLGNGPNMLVQSVAKSEGIRAPSFVGFMIWSLFFLMPILALIAILFFV